MNAQITEILKALADAHTKLIDEFKRDLMSTDDETARRAWVRMDEARGIEIAMDIVRGTKA